MISIGVAERDGGTLTAALRALLSERNISAEARPCAAGGRYDLLLCAVPPPAGAESPLLAAAEGCAAEAAARCGAETVLTCGLDPRCTLTPSSLLGEGMAALQRETPALSGALCLPGDLPLPEGGAPEQRLLLAAALLLLEG